jgi:hypothetical protein
VVAGGWQAGGWQRLGVCDVCCYGQHTGYPSLPHDYRRLTQDDVIRWAPVANPCEGRDGNGYSRSVSEIELGRSVIEHECASATFVPLSDPVVHLKVLFTSRESRASNRPPSRAQTYDRHLWINCNKFLPFQEPPRRNTKHHGITCNSTENELTISHNKNAESLTLGRSV